MSTLLTCSSLSHTVANQKLFNDIHLSIHDQDRIALVGHNGSGKSSLIALLNQQAEPDEGRIALKRGLRFETVEQFLPVDLEDCTLFEAVQQKIEGNPNMHDYQATLLLQELGFQESEFDFKVKHLSGGQKNRLMFARAVISEPELVFLDEPTNHLDLDTILFFENYFKTSLKCAFLLISHDRHFLDAVTTRTLFLRDQRLYAYNLSYTPAKKELEAHDAAALEARRQEEKKIESLRASAKRLATWGKVYDNEDLARKAKSMEKRIERMEQDKTFVSKGSGLQLDLNFTESKSKQMLAVHQQTIAFNRGRPNAKELFTIDSLVLNPGDRIALLGSNGCGKTTFIRTVMDMFALDAVNRIGFSFSPQAKVGYYDQELEQLDSSKTMIEMVRDRCEGHDADLRRQLIHAGFPYGDHQKEVRVLSGGEKARVLFLILKINSPNFLILDEPTNHIDIQGKEELEEQLMASQATVLITSHDRRFVETITNRFLWVHEGQLEEIHDPQIFYQATASQNDEQTASMTSSAGESPALNDSEILMEKIIVLEEKLEADLQRKPKHQKPKLQEQWRQELEQYYAQLES